MDEYISRKKLLEFPYVNGHFDEEHGNKQFKNGCESYKEYIEWLPAEDVRPVVRGEWIHKNWLFDYDCCSICGYEHRATSTFNFCPNCGAEMHKEFHNDILY